MAEDLNFNAPWKRVYLDFKTEVLNEIDRRLIGTGISRKKWIETLILKSLEESKNGKGKK